MKRLAQYALLGVFLVFPNGGTIAWPGDEEQRGSSDRGAPVRSSELRGNAAETGGDGCYFGECPTGTASPNPQQRPTPQSPAPQPQQPPVVLPMPAPQPQVTWTNICQTRFMWCQTYDLGYVGQSCTCMTPAGLQPGVAVPRRF
jgi:hypothetical protein